MAKLLAELDRRDRESALRLPAKTTAKTHRVGSALVALLLVAGAGGVVYVATHHTAHAAAATSRPPVAVGDDSATTGEKIQHLDGRVPSPGVGEQKSRLLPVPTAPAGTGGYQLLDAKYGPPRYDPCRPIHYVIGGQGAPPGGDVAIQQAVAAVSKATGLKFIADGTTTELPTTKRVPYQPARYGDRWAPVLIAWTTPARIPQLKGDVGGLGGSQLYRAGPGPYTYVTGQIMLDAPQLTKLQAGPNGNLIVRTTIEHELGHVMGLGHVKDASQIMYPEGTGQIGYGAGDLRGLAYEGRGACHPEL